MTEAGALVISAAIEGPIAFLIVRFTRWPSRGALHVGLASAVATAVTHPQLWSAALWAYSRFAYWPATILLEALVIVVEGVLITWMAELAFPRAMFVSLITNSASFLIVITYYLMTM
jgi:hypothetical protein